MRTAFSNPKVYVGILVYFCVLVSFNAIGFWAPTIIKDVGVKDLVDVGWLSSVVFLAGAIGTYVVGYSSDRTMERRWHLTASCAVITLCFALLPLAAHSIALAVALLSLAAAASYGSFVVFWTLPPASCRVTPRRAALP